MPKITTLEKSFTIKLQALYDIEKQLEKALPQLLKKAVNPKLKDAFRNHLVETKNHSLRLEKIFKFLDQKPTKLKSEGIRGIIMDSKWVLDADAPEIIKDLMIASSARYAEHYEMAGYLGAIEMADALGLDEAVLLLTETFNEEHSADKLLSTINEKNLLNT